MIGTTLAGKYRVKRLLGAGGMGAVYEGEHIEIGKRVAIKVIDGEHSQSEQLAARFRQEARAASAVESENIVQVFDVGHDEAAGLYMVMEYLAGEDLSAYLERSGGKLSIEEGVTIVAQAARGLAKAHAAGVVHRDLKPANLFLTKREDDSTCVKVVDFGISKLHRPDVDGKPATITREGSVVGTPIYMSPEQAQGLKVDARTDIWSLGALAYEVLSGRPPYPQLATYEQMIIQIVTQPIPSLSDIAPWVPYELCTVIENALRHDVTQRTADASRFARDLAEAAHLMPISTGSSPRIKVDSEPKVTNALGATLPDERRGSTGAVANPPTDPEILPDGVPKRRPLLVAASIALAVGALAAIGFALVGRPPAPAKAAGLVPAAASPAATGSASIATLPARVAAAASGREAPPEPAPVPAASSAVTVPPARPAAAIQAGGARPPPAPPVPAPAPAPAKPGGQYGAAGVSTSY